MAAPRPHLVNAWADLVFHVLAHVRGNAHLAPSVYDATYVQACEQTLGKATERPLGEDIQNLGGLLSAHELLAHTQLLAWLFSSTERAARCAERDLSQLAREDVDRPELLPTLVKLGPPVEILRAAAELEQPIHAKLHPPEIDLDLLSLALAEATEVAPALAACTVGVSRALRLRGRIYAGEIWIGLAPSIDHMAWQASHEATVGEVVDARKASGLPFDHDEVEREAIRLLGERAAQMGRAEPHGRWLSHFRTP